MPEGRSRARSGPSGSVSPGISFHGIALNVTTNLADFDLIDPCGMPGLRSTSLARERGAGRRPGGPRIGPPTTASVAAARPSSPRPSPGAWGSSWSVPCRLPPTPLVERRALGELAGAATALAGSR